MTDDHSAPQPPGKARMLWRGLTRGCPACGKRRLFPGPLRMLEDCPRCGLHFERIEGHWIGAIGINTIVSFGLMVLTLIVVFVATWPNTTVLNGMPPLLFVGIVVPLGFFGSSRTVWTAIDIMMRPLGAEEVDWTAVDPGYTPDRPSRPPN